MTPAHQERESCGVGLRVLVCGGRRFGERCVVFDALDKLSVAVVIEGGATGADRLGREWAEARRVRCLSFPADWGRYGKLAGPMRNQEMLDQGKPDIVLAFPGGLGTADMIRRARAACITIHHIRPTPSPTEAGR